jgi:MinD superfamily P-loop ATPase
MSLKYDLRKILAIVLTDKGGVGKSFVAQILNEMYKGPDEQYSVSCIDSDVGNSSTAQIFETAEFAGVRDVNDLEAFGTIYGAVQKLADRTCDAVVWDTAAGTEQIVKNEVMPSLLRRAAKAGVTIVVYRPITTSQYTQDDAVRFAEWAMAFGIAVVFVRNLGQGRAARFFVDWDQDSERKKVMPPATEVVLPDLGCWVADEAASLRLSLRPPLQGGARDRRTEIHAQSPARGCRLSRTAVRRIHRSHGQGPRQYLE